MHPILQYPTAIFNNILRYIAHLILLTGENACNISNILEYCPMLQRRGFSLSEVKIVSVMDQTFCPYYGGFF